MNNAPCKTNGDDEHNETCPFCGALPQARCRYEEVAGEAAESATN